MPTWVSLNITESGGDVWFIKEITARLLYGVSMPDDAERMSHGREKDPSADASDAPTQFVLNNRTYEVAENSRNDVVRLASGLVRAVLRANTHNNRNGLMAHMIHHEITSFLSLTHSNDPVEMARSAFDSMAVRVADDLSAYESVDRMRSQIKPILDSFPPTGHRVGTLGSAIAQWGRAVAGLRRQRLGPEDIQAAAPAAEGTIDHELARLFLRLGPPPEPTSQDYTPAGSDGGGAQQ